MDPNTFLKQLLFSTVRIVAETDMKDDKSVGTGFLIEKKITETEKQIFLVTNKHVIAQTDCAGKIIGKFTKGFFSFIKSANNSPKLGEFIEIRVENLTELFFLHPDESVDLAIANISNIFNRIVQELRSNVFIRSISIEMIPSENESFDAIEDIIFVGYPNGIFDQKNHLPIMRKGITASPFEIDFSGSKKFIIDAQAFPGSSGSPIFIKENKLKGGSLVIGPERYFFAGIISKVFRRSETGEFIETVAPTTSQNYKFHVKQMIGLGICEKSSQIIDLIELYGKNSS